MDVSKDNQPEWPESHWISLARQGREDAWRELHQRYYPGLWHTAHQILHDAALAEDVVQEAFIKAHRQIHRFRGDSKFSTWLYRITHNQAQDTLRKIQRRSKWLGLFPLSTPGPNGELSPMPEPADPSGDAAQHAARRDDREAIAKALQSLSPEHRIVVELRLIQGFSTEETARILKLKKGTVLSRLFYSCQNLKKILQPIRDEHA